METKDVKGAKPDPNTEVTVGMLKELLKKLPDDTCIRVWDHYLGYAVHADVYAKLKLGQLHLFNDMSTGRADLTVMDIRAFEKMQTDKDFKLRCITVEQEEDISFEKKSVTFYVPAEENGELNENKDS